MTERQFKHLELTPFQKNNENIIFVSFLIFRVLKTEASIVGEAIMLRKNFMLHFGDVQYKRGSINLDNFDQNLK